MNKKDMEQMRELATKLSDLANECMAMCGKDDADEEGDGETYDKVVPPGKKSGLKDDMKNDTEKAFGKKTSSDKLMLAILRGK